MIMNGTLLLFVAYASVARLVSYKDILLAYDKSHDFS